jgi:hypothetical protein
MGDGVIHVPLAPDTDPYELGGFIRYLVRVGAKCVAEAEGFGTSDKSKFVQVVTERYPSMIPTFEAVLQPPSSSQPSNKIIADAYVLTEKLCEMVRHA